MNKNSNQLYLALLMVPAVFLPGCTDWFQKKVSEGDATQPAEQVKETAKGKGSDTGKVAKNGAVLVSFKGETVLTVEGFERDFDKLLDENPQLKSVLPFMPDAKRKYAEGVVSQLLIDEEIKNKKIDQTQEYKDDLANMIMNVKRMVNQKYFGKKHTTEVVEADVKKYYEDNKDTMPDLLLSRGGVSAAGVSFKKEEDAQAFLAKVKESKDELSKVADSADLTKKFRDFYKVNTLWYLLIQKQVYVQNFEVTLL